MNIKFKDATRTGADLFLKVFELDLTEHLANFRGDPKPIFDKNNLEEYYSKRKDVHIFDKSLCCFILTLYKSYFTDQELQDLEGVILSNSQLFFSLFFHLIYKITEQTKILYNHKKNIKSIPIRIDVFRLGPYVTVKTVEPFLGVNFLLPHNGQ